MSTLININYIIIEIKLMHLRQKFPYSGYLKTNLPHQKKMDLEKIYSIHQKEHVLFFANSNE